MNLQEQPTPSESLCPRCGGEPGYSPQHRLSNLGYLHDDVHFTCSECKLDWTCGVPIGEYRGKWADELFCDSCEEEYGLVHRVGVDDNRNHIRLHMKCPNPDCYNFWKVKRETDENGLALTGYSVTTGSMEGAEPHGYVDE